MTGEAIRPATEREHYLSTQAGPTGVFVGDEPARAVFVAGGPEPVTDDQITALSDEAAGAGDLDQVEVCARALAGDAEARAECQRVIEDAAAA